MEKLYSGFSQVTPVSVGVGRVETLRLRARLVVLRRKRSCRSPETVHSSGRRSFGAGFSARIRLHCSVSSGAACSVSAVSVSVEGATSCGSSARGSSATGCCVAIGFGAGVGVTFGAACGTQRSCCSFTGAGREGSSMLWESSGDC